MDTKLCFEAINRTLHRVAAALVAFSKERLLSTFCFVIASLYNVIAIQGRPCPSANSAPAQGQNCFGALLPLRIVTAVTRAFLPDQCPLVAAFLISLLTSEIAAEIAQNSTEFYRIGRYRSPLQSSVRSSLSFLGTLAPSTQFRRKMDYLLDLRWEGLIDVIAIQGRPWPCANSAPVQGRNCVGPLLPSRIATAVTRAFLPDHCPSVPAFLIRLLASEIAAEIAQNSTKYYRIGCCRSPLQSSVRSSLSFLGTLVPSTQFRRKMGDAWFLNSPEESLGFVLADEGFDGTIMSLAALIQSDMAELVEAAARLYIICSGWGV
ncbi:unnamed protein product [Malus baccata var. baccata]